MAYGGFKDIDATAELGRNPVSKHQIQPEYGDEQADAERDCRTRHQILRRERGQGSTADHKQDWQPYSVDPYSCYIFMCDQTNKSFRIILGEGVVIMCVL